MTFRAAIGLPALVLLAAACNPFESKFTTACEEALKDTLRSPATYKRIEINEASVPISVDEFLPGGDQKNYRELLRSRGAKPIRKRLLITYDAVNAYNAPIRSTTECAYDTSDGDASQASKLFVKIDGKTSTDRLLEAARELKHDGRQNRR